MGRVAIHCEPRIKWQGDFALKMQKGLRRIGIDSFITTCRSRETDIAILLGTTCWRSVEAFGKYLLVDRASYGDPYYVQLVWDGHGRRGNHCVPKKRGNRWESIGLEVLPWATSGHRVLLCGQTETYSPYFLDVKDWYKTVRATHFRCHPAGDNPTNLPCMKDWADVGRVVTLNSSIGVESVLTGIPTVTMDEGAMAWDVSSHSASKSITPDRRRWLHWLAWTQWNHDEIEAGKPIKHLFEDAL